jgi:hypothetical protein
MTAQLVYPLGTLEYVSATVTADVSLDAQAVTISIDSGATWLPATWVGSPGTTRKVRTSNPVSFAVKAAWRQVLIKIVDNPEIPIVEAGSIRVGGG